jgi:hypothetical protein
VFPDADAGERLVLQLEPNANGGKQRIVRSLIADRDYG